MAAIDSRLHCPICYSLIVRYSKLLRTQTHASSATVCTMWKLLRSWQRTETCERSTCADLRSLQNYCCLLPAGCCLHQLGYNLRTQGFIVCIVIFVLSFIAVGRLWKSAGSFSWLVLLDNEYHSNGCVPQCAYLAFLCEVLASEISEQLPTLPLGFFMSARACSWATWQWRVAVVHACVTGTWIYCHNCHCARTSIRTVLK